MDRLRVLASQINTTDPFILQTALPFGKTVVQLNNERRRNAISTAMQRTIQTIVKNPSNEIIIFKGNDKGVFGCGGDVKDLFQYFSSEDKKEMYSYYFTEFATNYCFYLLNNEPTQKYGSIAIYDGFTIGEAFILTCYSRIKICTERTILAMPECKNGLTIYFPQYFSQMKRNTGVYLWMTGESIKGKDCVAYGAADYYVHSSELASLMKELENANGFLECRQICEKYGNKDTSVSEEAEAKLKCIERIFNLDLDFIPFWERLVASASDSSNSVLAGHCQTWKHAMDVSSKIALAFNHWLLKRCTKPYENIPFNQLQVRAAININIFYKDSHHGLTRAVLNKNHQPTWTHSSVYDITNEEMRTLMETKTQVEDQINTFLQKCHDDMQHLPKN